LRSDKVLIGVGNTKIDTGPLLTRGEKGKKK